MPESRSVPEPVLVKFLDAPAMTPPYVSVAPEATSTVPWLAPSVIPRLEFKVNEPDAANVPPSKVIDAAVTEPGAVPRFASADTDNVPAEIVDVPVYVFVPLNTNVPEPVFVTLSDAPVMTPP